MTRTFTRSFAVAAAFIGALLVIVAALACGTEVAATSGGPATGAQIALVP